LLGPEAAEQTTGVGVLVLVRVEVEVGVAVEVAVDGVQPAGSRSE